MMVLALIVGSLLIAAGAAGSSLVLMFFGFLICFGAWCEHRPNVLRMLKDGRTIIDHSKGAWTIVAFDGRWWLAHMGEDWVRRYGHTWAIGKGRDHVWWYEPKGGRHVGE
jgi:hypothetical protein